MADLVKPIFDALRLCGRREVRGRAVPRVPRDPGAACAAPRAGRRAAFAVGHGTYLPRRIHRGPAQPQDGDLLRREDEKGIRASQQQVEALIEREVERGVPRSRIVLAGFSQGGAIALQTGLRQVQPLAAIIALSCYLPLADNFARERVAANARVPIFMAHGTSDPVVPLARGTASREALVAAGHHVEWHQYPMPHSVNEQEIRDIAAFLKRVLP